MDSEASLADAAAKSERDRTQRHPAAWASLAVLFLLVVLSYVDRMTIVLMVEPIRQSFGLSDLQISYLQGLAFALCFALAGPPLAWIADRYSRVGVIFCGVTIWSVATVASGLVASYPHLLATRFLVGVGEAALMPAAFSLLADLFPKKQHALAFGIVSAGAAVGGALAIGGGGYLIEAVSASGIFELPVIGTVQPWQLIFIVAGLPGIAIAPLTLFIPDSPSDHRHPAAISSSKLPLLGWLRCNLVFSILFSLAVSLLCAVAYGISSWTPTFFIRSYGLAISDFSSALALIQLIAGLLGYVGGGYITDRLAERGVRNAPYVYLAVVATILLLSGLGAFALRAGPSVSLAFLALFHLVLPYTGIVAAELHLTAPRHLRAQVIALITAVYTLLGMVAGPTSIAFLTDRVFGDPVQLASALATAAAIYCPSVLVLLFLSRHAAASAIAEAADVKTGHILK